jgi:hypothetical protein
MEGRSVTIPEHYRNQAEVSSGCNQRVIDSMAFAVSERLVSTFESSARQLLGLGQVNNNVERRIGQRELTIK